MYLKKSNVYLAFRLNAWWPSVSVIRWFILTVSRLRGKPLQALLWKIWNKKQLFYIKNWPSTSWWTDTGQELFLNIGWSLWSNRCQSVPLPFILKNPQCCCVWGVVGLHRCCTLHTDPLWTLTVHCCTDDIECVYVTLYFNVF